jgi:esterase
MTSTESTPAGLHYQSFGSGPPLVILHGLFGCRHNWYPVARALADRFRVLAVDQRNHGGSFHAEPLDYDQLAGDLLRFMDDLALPQAALLGHSMGGKAALQFADRHPERVARMVIVDITHRGYPPTHRPAIDALCGLHLAGLTRLKEADARLQPLIPDPGLRLFLMKNLTRSPGGLRWKINLEAVRCGYEGLCGPLALRGGRTPALFVCGGRSDYVREDDWPEVQRLFPRAQRVVLTGAGHWVHVDDQPGFVAAVRPFLQAAA